MVYQMPCPGKEGVFVASSYLNEDQAHQELQGWAAGHGYRFAPAERTFTVYGIEQQTRQWVLLERDAELSAQSKISAPSDTGR